MNVLDSELVAASLVQHGHAVAPSARQADTILFNTCSVRQHAEDKIYSALGRLKHLKQTHPHKIIGVLGCMAQKDQETIFRRAPHVDLVVGPGQLGRLPELLAEVESERRPLLEVSLDRKAARRVEVQESFSANDGSRPGWIRPNRHQAMLRIMFGCDKFCTYCIVPRVRGPEQSRRAAEILAEARRLVEQGCLEITLLGQTVNSYCDRSGGGRVSLADLLGQLHELAGLRRLRFVTNYPRHMTDDLIQAVAALPKVCPYFHVPAQSGSDAVLRRMKRGYTSAEYRDMLVRIRAAVPEAAITSDFIVGYCGETEEDYQQTVRLVEQSRFKNSFIFKYSTRPGTKAAGLYPDDVPDEAKRRRNNELLAIQNAISEADNQAFVGRRVEVLVEGPSKAGRKHQRPTGDLQLTGRTVCDRIVVFDGPSELAGQVLSVRVHAANAVTLFADPVTATPQPAVSALP
jgi:tRNA-2-methylthio-N6-dimethylallyladenosine synthase